MKARTTPCPPGSTKRSAFVMAMLRAAVASVLLVLAAMTAPQSVSAATPSAADQQCLLCHGAPGLDKKLADGKTLPLQVQPDHFAQSVHAALGCTGCHADVNLASHPPAVNPIASKRVLSTAMIQLCKTCHTREADQWSHSVHAALSAEGNPAAPICTDCHSPHSMVKGEAGKIATVPCQSCHSDVFAAYTKSVHGVLRTGGLALAPLCFDCHGAHDVTVPSAGVGRKDVCLGCHTEALNSHRTWLPNVDLHFGVVSCPVCHTPKAQRVVNLILYNSATQQEVAGPVGMPEFVNLAAPAPTPGNAAGTPGLDPATLAVLLRTLDHEGVQGRTSIRGRLDVRTGIEDHQLTFAADAIRDCAVCHQKGAAAFQSVEVSLAGPAGMPVHISADKDVLNSVFTLYSVSGFYAIGGSRMGVLDVLFVLALLGGIGWPIFHATQRWVFRRYLNRMPELHPPAPKPKE
jgi:hypothetical protein